MPSVFIAPDTAGQLQRRHGSSDWLTYLPGRLQSQRQHRTLML